MPGSRWKLISGEEHEVQLARIVRTNLVILFSGICAVAQQPPAAELDIRYGKDSALQVVDLYMPATKGFTTVVYTYGGGWHFDSSQACAGEPRSGRKFGPRVSSPRQIERITSEISRYLRWQAYLLWVE